MPLVSVITRTRDRPIMMDRAARSVTQQTFSDFEWTIVNDGGPAGPIESLAENAREKGLHVRVIHNETSLGMEGASNAGLRQTDSRFVVIHDDDDTWHQDFLAGTTAYLLDLPENGSTMGVVSRTTKVVEEIRSDRIVEKRRSPYDAGLKGITLFQMAHLHRVPPPISFLYRREVLASIGLYRDDLEVLGDWEFNLRFLSKFDIDVIPQYLANYHWRTTIRSGIYGNTVVAGIDRHARCAARLRNEFLRSDLDSGRLGLGFLVNICQEFESLGRKRSIPARILRRVVPETLRLGIVELFDA